MARRWEEDWHSYARVARALFTALRARAPRARARGMPDAWRTFLGSDAVTWLVNAGHVRARGEAVALGRVLVRDGLVSHVGDRRGFEDDRYSVYLFHMDSPDDVAYRIGVLHAPVRKCAFDELQQQQLSCPRLFRQRKGKIVSKLHLDHVRHHLQREQSADSLLAFSEASLELNDRELLNGDWGEKVRPLNASHPRDTEAEPGAFRLDAALCGTEFDEPQVAYKVLSIMSFEKNPSDPARRPHRATCGIVESSRDRKITHPSPPTNLPAFRQKLSTALSDRQPQPQPHHDQQPVFANAPAFRQKLTAAFSNTKPQLSHQPRRSQTPVFVNPSDFRDEWYPEPHPLEERISEPPSNPPQQHMYAEPTTPDRARSVHSGRWGSRAGLREMARPLLSRTSKLFRARRQSARSESGMSRYR